MRLLVVVLLLVVALGGSWLALSQSTSGPAHAGDDAASEAPDLEDGDGSAPALKGSARGEAAKPPAAGTPVPAHIRALVAECASGDPDRQDAALKKLRAIHRKEPFPFEWLLRWALTEIPPGQSNPLVGLALAELASRREETLKHLNEILGSAVGAGRAKQEAVGRLLMALRGGRYGDGKALAPEHVPVIIRIFEHKESGWGLKRDLVTAIEDLGAEGVPLAPALVGYIGEVLADRAVAAKEAAEAGISVSWDHVEYEVERLLASMGPDVVPRLVEVLRAMYAKGAKDADGYWQDPTGIVAGALAGAGEEGIRALLVLARDPRVRVRHDVCWALREVEGPHEAVRGALLDLLKDDDADIREHAAKLLAKHGEASIPELLQSLRDADGGVRQASAASLSTLGVKPDDVMATMLEMLASDDRGAVMTAADTIARFGIDAIGVFPRLLARLETEDRRLRERLAESCSLLAPLKPAMVQAAWSKAGVFGRRGILSMLLRLEGVDGHGRPRPSDPRLTAMIPLGLEDADLWIRVRAAAHLAGAGTPRVAEILREGFASKDGEIRTYATSGVGRLGGEGADLLPVLLVRLQHGGGLWRPGPMAGDPEGGEPFELGEAVAELGRFDPKRMFELLDHDSWDVGYAAALSFERQGVAGYAWLEAAFAGGRAGQKIEALDVAGSGFFKQGEGAGAIHAAARDLVRKGLADADPQVRLKAVEALRRDAEQRASLALPVLLALLDSKDADVVSSAAYQLYTLGVAAAPARGAIEGKLPQLPKAVARTLRQLLAIIDTGGAK